MMNMFFSRFAGLRGRFALLLLLGFLSGSVLAQLGGDHSFGFLNLPVGARQASLGGNMVPVFDNDLSLVAANPAALHSGMHNQVFLGFTDYFAGVNYGYASYSRSYENAGSIAISLLNLNYGEFTEADDLGNVTGSFRAKEYAYGLTWAMPLDSFFQIGVSGKLAHAVYDRYSSLALAADLGLSYHHSKHLLTASLVVRNLGRQVKDFYEGDSGGDLPMEIEFGVSKRLGHAPFRFFLVAQQMQAWKIGQGIDEQEPDPFSGEEPDAPGLAEMAWRHVVVGAEFIPSSNFFINLGYNALRRHELKMESRPGMAGFSWGFGLKLSKFRLSYGRGIYHLAGASNHISLSTVFSDYGKKRKI